MELQLPVVLGHYQTTTVLAGIVVTGLLVLLLQMLYNFLLHPLAVYPGPRLHSVSPLPYLLGMMNGHHHLIIKELHDKFGPVVRYAPDKLSYISGEAWKDIYGHKKVGQTEMAKSPQFYLHDPKAQSIVFSDKAAHARFRRLLSHGFSDKSLRNQEPLITKYVDMLVQGLQQVSSDGTDSVDMVAWFNWTTFDIIGDLTFGESFGCLENAEMHPWVKAVFSAIKGMTWLRLAQHIPVIGPSLPALLPKVIRGGVLKKRQQHIGLTKQKVQRRLDIKEDRFDFMEGILRQPEGKGMSFPELLINSSILIIAGSETTATWLSGTLFLLLRNPEKLGKLVAEIRSSFGTEEDISIETSSRLKYLAACIEESLRVYPPIPTGLPRVVPAGGELIEGNYVPGGTYVAVDQYAAYHSIWNFEQPDSFIPERFLADSPFSSDKKESCQAFSTGPRNCIGKNLAYAEAKLILARVLFRFDFKLDSASNGWMQQLSYTIWEKHPLLVHVSPRR